MSRKSSKSAKSSKGIQSSIFENLEARQMFTGMLPPTVPVEGKLWTYQVTFGSHEATNPPPSAFDVDIEWGDGSQTRATDIERIEGTNAYRATATHMYRDSGLRHALDNFVFIRNNHSGQDWVQDQLHGRIADAPIEVKTLDQVVEADTEVSTVFATFTSECVFDTADEFTAHIYSPGKISLGTIEGGGGSFVVSGKHHFGYSSPDSVIKVVVLSDDETNAGADGVLTVLNKVKYDEANDIFQLGADAQNEDAVQNWAEEFNSNGIDVQEAVNDAANNFGVGLVTDFPPTPISLTNPAKYPFSRSFFDAGRMLKGVGAGLGDLWNLASYIVQNPNVLSPQFAGQLVAEAALNGIQNPGKVMAAIYNGFAGLNNVDPGFFAGRTIPAAVLTGVLFEKGSQLFKKLPEPVQQGLAPIRTMGESKFYLSGNSAVQIAGAATPEETQFLLAAMKDVNPGYFSGNPDFLTNCVVTTWNLDQKFAGIPLGGSLPSGALDLEVLEALCGGQFGPASGLGGLGTTLTNAGNGARGIVAFNQTGTGVGHVLNVVNRNGTLWFLDGQSGLAFSSNSATMFEYFGRAWNFKFLRTK